MKTRSIKYIWSAVFVCAAMVYIFFPRYQRYQITRIDLFDTVTTFIGYTVNEKKFNYYANIIFNEMERLHALYDIYNPYAGLNNIWTVNEQAGIKPVSVDSDLIALIQFGKTAHAETNGAVNIAIGPVTELWRIARENGLDDPENAAVPDKGLLSEAALFINMEDVIINESEGTLFLKKAGMRLDVGALAKGYAAEKAMRLAAEAGMKSGLLDAGGNIVAVGGPREIDRDKWGVSLTDPVQKLSGINAYLDRLYITNASVVTSGSYERFFAADGKRYGHIIDPSTLSPAELYAGVTVIHEDSGVAEMLSTALFILPVETGKNLVSEWMAEAVWIYPDGGMVTTAGYNEYKLP
jgi:thiamine biosynthesis lipoprotein